MHDISIIARILHDDAYTDHGGCRTAMKAISIILSKECRSRGPAGTATSAVVGARAHMAPTAPVMANRKTGGWPTGVDTTPKAAGAGVMILCGAWADSSSRCITGG
jgi:hypothetical protein